MTSHMGDCPAWQGGACTCADLPEGPPPIDRLAALIREVDGSNSLGAGALAERLIECGVTFGASASSAPAPAVTDAEWKLLHDMADNTKRSLERVAEINERLRGSAPAAAAPADCLPSSKRPAGEQTSAGPATAAPREPSMSEREIAESKQARDAMLETYRPGKWSAAKYVRLWNVASNLSAALDYSDRRGGRAAPLSGPPEEQT